MADKALFVADHFALHSTLDCNSSEDLFDLSAAYRSFNENLSSRTS